MAPAMRFRDACAEAGVPVTAAFDASEHEWGYWDVKIQEVLGWLPLAGTTDISSPPRSGAGSDA